MASQDDWRRAGQERYLRGASFTRESYRPPRPEWDHDHCAFCWATFAAGATAEVTEGYRTLDGTHWICPKCWSDFAGEFGFTLRT
jgi:hypothetical protein